MQLKHHKNPKSKSPGKREKLLKLIHPLLRKLVIKGNFFLFAVGPAKS
jgi:hypothetical protein